MIYVEEMHRCEHSLKTDYLLWTFEVFEKDFVA